MIDEIKVNTTRLRTDAEKVNKYISNIEASKKALQECLVKLDKMWDGEASEAFKKAMAKDILELEAMIENLKEIYKYETNAKNKYDTCEGRVAELIAQIKV